MEDLVEKKKRKPNKLIWKMFLLVNISNQVRHLNLLTIGHTRIHSETIMVMMNDDHCIF